MGWDQPENDPPPAPKPAAKEPPSALESRLFERMSLAAAKLPLRTTFVARLLGQ